MANEPSLPSDIAAKVGYSLHGWNHVRDVASKKLPTQLAHANRVRRGALELLARHSKLRG